MTIYECGLKELTDRGMFDDQAKEIMEKVFVDSHSNLQSPNHLICDRWNDDINGYPPAMQTLLFMGIEPFALEYIKEKCPEAWFRPMFDRDHPLRKEYENSKI